MGWLSLVPWKLVAALGALALSAAFGAYQMAKHDATRYAALQEEYVTFRAEVTAKASAQEAATKMEVVRQKRITLDNQNKALAEIASLDAHYQSVLSGVRESANSSGIVPGVPGAAPGANGEVCFDRAALAGRMDGALQRLLDGSARVLQRGDQALALVNLCRAWVREQGIVSSGTAQPGN